MRIVRCTVRGCSTTSEAGVKLFSFPRFKDQCKDWVSFCKNPALERKFASGATMGKTQYRVCAIHFMDCCFHTARREKLFRGVLPSLYPPLPEDSIKANGDMIVTGLNEVVRLTIKVEKDLQNEIPMERFESLPDVPLLNDLGTLRQPNFLPDLQQSNVQMNTEGNQDKFHLIEETSEMYSLITLPYLEKADLDLQWVYRIISGEEECERIVYQSPDKDDKNGFLLIKDTKWDVTNLNTLHLIAIAYRPGIMSLRDLGAEHLCLLQNIISTGKAVIKKKYGVVGTQLRIFLQYAPSFYHLHVHFTAMNDDICGPHFGSAHPLCSVIRSIQVFPTYYQAVTLTLCLKESDKLFQEFEARGLVERIGPS